MSIVVRNGCKSYSDKIPVLKKINLNVKAGTIFGLLGASGCGKTTLLSCIVGLKKLDHGEIYVQGSTPGTKGGLGIGFMPQSSTTIPPSFNIQQTFWFFGRIYGMSGRKIEERIDFLTEFLQLSDTSKLIRHLSGGELRRINLGLAMIHQPQVLILDEPTVGLDPLLSIWEHLLDLVTMERKITILLTTHYSEEAKSCGTIGIMRGGRIIAEESPEQILCQTNSLLLETAILQLCRQDEDFPNSIHVNSFPQNLQETNFVEEEIKYSSKWKNVIIVFALLYRSLIINLKQPMIIMVQILLPLINLILASFIVAEPNGLTLNFVNNDWNSLQNQTQILDYCGDYKEMKNRTCFPQGINMLCSFFNQYEKNDVNWVAASSDREALISVQEGNSIGYLRFPTNFSQHLADRLLFKKYSEINTIDGSTITVRMDMTNAISKMWLLEKLFDKYFAFINSLAKDCDTNSRTVQIPFKYRSVYGDVNGGSWSEFFQPFIILLITNVLSSTIPGIILTLDRCWGVTDRLTIAGIKFCHIVVSSFIYASFVISLQIVILFTVLDSFFGMSIEGSWPLAMFTVYMSCAAGVAIGILLSTMIKHEMEFILMTMFFILMNFFSSGGIWPIDSINPWYKTICQLVPITLPLESLRSIIHRGWGLEYLQVWKGLAISLFYIVFSIILGNWFHNRK